MKLSKTQLEVLRLMASGEWELGFTSGFGDAHYWMQKGGLGRGGETKKINVKTGHALYRKGFTELSKLGFPTSHYRLTEKGQKALEEEN